MEEKKIKGKNKEDIEIKKRTKNLRNASKVRKTRIKERVYTVGRATGKKRNNKKIVGEVFDTYRMFKRNLRR